MDTLPLQAEYLQYIFFSWYPEPREHTVHSVHPAKANADRIAVKTYATIDRTSIIVTTGVPRASAIHALPSDYST